MLAQISQLPTRYEALIDQFGVRAQTTFVAPIQDLDFIKRTIQSIKSANQSKLLFLSGRTGQGKTTFIQSLSLFLPDQIREIIRLPAQFDLPISEVVKNISQISVGSEISIVNFDGREAPFFDESEYRSFLIQLNALLRSRKDLLIIWPVNEPKFAEQIVNLMQSVAGKSAFGMRAIYEFQGIDSGQYIPILEKINQIANWKIEDAALSFSDLDLLKEKASSVGDFLDEVHQMIVERFDVSNIGTNLPKVVFSLSSDRKDIKELCRSVRRADSFYLEASRLLMYTKRSNVAEWWETRNKNVNTNLNYIIALFNAELVSISGSSVVHAVKNFGDEELKSLIPDITKNIGNAKRVITASELYKFSLGQSTDAREYGLSPNEETLAAYKVIQSFSKTKHRSINASIFGLLKEANSGFINIKYEQRIGPKSYIQADAIVDRKKESVHLEFHHKAEAESTQNKISIYVLEKLKEYSVAYGLCPN